MKEITVERFSKEAVAMLEVSQREKVLVTRRGKPLALLVGIANKDAEDRAWERDEEFWQMIHERRKAKTISLAEMKRRLGMSEAKPRKQRAK